MTTEHGSASLEALKFTSALTAKPALGRWAVETTLDHFAIATYRVDAAALSAHLHPRFEPDCVTLDGSSRALVSVVTFRDRDFRFAAFPWVRRAFGQTNYRAYVRDTVTGEHVAWFFGTCLDSLTVHIPRFLWKLPWHRARMDFACRFDRDAGRYTEFAVATESAWSPGRLDIVDSGKHPAELPGFVNLEAGLLLLTHPMKGYYRRRDGTLGTYTIWHDRLTPTVGDARVADYPLLHRLGLVAPLDLSGLHSVLIQPSVEFAVYLPPHQVTDREREQ